MFELEGKYNKCKVFTDNADFGCIGQIQTLLNQESIKDSKIRIMPDCHAGVGCVIGTTMTIHDKVIPNLVGVDINCGMRTVMLKEKRIDLPKLDSVIRKCIPSGGNINTKGGKYSDNVDIRTLRCFGKSNVSPEVAYLSIGTLGGGNHFIEIDKDDDENLYLVIHTGSRKLGKDVAEYYQKRAFEIIPKYGTTLKELEREAREKFINEMKKAGRHKEIDKALSRWTFVPPEDAKNPIPYNMAYCQDQLFDDYIHDMKIVEGYAYWNRRSIADTILKEMKLHSEDEFETVHNYIDLEHMILRKGSVSAQKGERILIPMNMRDGSLICIGKGNEDWNYSAPHGAGRLLSRSEAKEKISMSDYKNTMNEAGIFSTSVTRDTIDESPFAYKPMEEIIENIQDTVDVVKTIKPIYNFKAGSED